MPSRAKELLRQIVKEVPFSGLRPWPLQETLHIGKLADASMRLEASSHRASDDAVRTWAETDNLVTAAIFSARCLRARFEGVTCLADC